MATVWELSIDIILLADNSDDREKEEEDNEGKYEFREDKDIDKG